MILLISRDTSLSSRCLSTHFSGLACAGDQTIANNIKAGSPLMHVWFDDEHALSRYDKDKVYSPGWDYLNNM